MAKQALQFGDKNTADVRLHIISSTEEGKGSVIFSHSQVLKKAEFFETKFSERWSSDKRPFEIKVTSSHGVEIYTKCIQLMYSYYADEGFCFSRVDEALAILPVASEVMFHECVKECMLYLDAVRWSAEQKVQIRALLSSLHIDPLPTLAARLGISPQKSVCGSGYIEMFKESLQHVLSMSLDTSGYRPKMEKQMLDYMDANASPAVKDASRSALLKEFNSRVEIIKSKSDISDLILACSALLCLIGLIQRFDRKLFAAVLKLFCEDTDLRNSITTRVVKSYDAGCDILDILVNFFLKAMGNGDIITPASFRVSFLTNWVDTMAMRSRHPEYVSALQKGIADVAETLPLVEQRLIYDIWKDAFTKNELSTTTAFNWWSDKLHSAFAIDKVI